MNRIHREQRFVSLRRRFVIFSVSLFGSIIAFIPAFQMMQKDFFGSGFSEFFSLIFSDSLVIIKYWQSFMLTLLEALPAVSIILFLVVICAFFGSLKFLVKNFRIILKFKTSSS
ncbi:MAG: hypothetical protein AB1465_05185 [Patescibacteria group bacterium]